MEKIDRITASADVLHGKPRIQGTRIAVEHVLDLLANGVTPDGVVQDYYPDLTQDDVLACLRFAREIVAFQDVVYG